MLILHNLQSSVRGTSTDIIIQVRKYWVKNSFDLGKILGVKSTWPRAAWHRKKYRDPYEEESKIKGKYLLSLWNVSDLEMLMISIKKRKHTHTHTHTKYDLCEFLEEFDLF